MKWRSSTFAQQEIINKISHSLYRQLQVETNNIMKPHQFLITATLALSAFAPVAHAATTAVSNLGESIDFGSGLIFPFATSFTTGASGSWLLDSVDLSVARFSGEGTGTVGVSIYDESGIIPDTNLTGEQTVTVPLGISTQSFDFSSSGLVLQASTTYWVVARQVGSSETTLNLNQTLSESETATLAGWSIGDFALLDPASNNTWGSINDDPFLFSVAVNPVPEPGSLMLIGFGALGLLPRRRRRNPQI